MIFQILLAFTSSTTRGDSCNLLICRRTVLYFRRQVTLGVRLIEADNHFVSNPEEIVRHLDFLHPGEEMVSTSKAVYRIRQTRDRLKNIG